MCFRTSKVKLFQDLFTMVLQHLHQVAVVAVHSFFLLGVFLVDALAIELALPFLLGQMLHKLVQLADKLADFVLARMVVELIQRVLDICIALGLCRVHF